MFFFSLCYKKEHNFTTLIKTPWNLAMFNHSVRIFYRLVADELKHLQALFMPRPLSFLHVFSRLLATASHSTNNTLIHDSRLTGISMFPPTRWLENEIHYTLDPNIHLMTQANSGGGKEKVILGRTVSSEENGLFIKAPVQGGRWLTEGCLVERSPGAQLPQHLLVL